MQNRNDKTTLPSKLYCYPVTGPVADKKIIELIIAGFYYVTLQLHRLMPAIVLSKTRASIRWTPPDDKRCQAKEGRHP
ncbi:MAG TPA: hypothetical protein PK926_17175, partial [Spirochaetota bacterium]|nr:hypothetical protein [Spirochaetota bacterium]HPR49951.1 hypothetical protein [Spirochaetota bacterium]